MSRAKQSPSRKRFKKAVPVLGAAAGLSLSLASGASAGPAPHMPTPAAAGHEIILAEEEISDVSLATFSVYDKENSAPFPPDVQLARGGCGGGGCRGCVRRLRVQRLRRLWRLRRLRWMCRLLALWGLRRLRGVRWMCTSLVGCRAAASNVFLSAAAG